MNSIPLFFNERQIKCAILGGSVKPSFVQLPVSVVLLSRGGSHYRAKIIENLLQCGFVSIVSVENDPENYNIEDFSIKYPSVKYVVALEPITAGEMVNIGIQESLANHVLVIWDDVRVSSSMLTAHLAKRLVELNQYCVVPRLLTKELQGLPVHNVPSTSSSVLKIERSTSVYDEMPTLYPVDFMGLYDRQRFITLGGFDYTIQTPYWQNLDLSLRAWLWGERISVATAFQIAYDGPVTTEDHTANLGELRFYLKNLVPIYKHNHGVIPLSSFLLFLFRSSCGFFESWRQFRDAKRWTEKNKYMFKMDAPALIQNWGEKEKKDR